MCDLACTARVVFDLGEVCQEECKELLTEMAPGGEGALLDFAVSEEEANEAGKDSFDFCKNVVVVVVTVCTDVRRSDEPRFEIFAFGSGARTFAGSIHHSAGWLIRKKATDDYPDRFKVLSILYGDNRVHVFIYLVDKHRADHHIPDGCGIYLFSEVVAASPGEGNVLEILVLGSLPWRENVELGSFELREKKIALYNRQR